MAAPIEDQRLADAAFVQAELAAAQPLGASRRGFAAFVIARERGGAVVGGEEDQRVVHFTHLVEPVEKAAERLVHLDPRRAQNGRASGRGRVGSEVMNTVGVCLIK